VEASAIETDTLGEREIAREISNAAPARRDLPAQTRAAI
jgi:hypothetical protein